MLESQEVFDNFSEGFCRWTPDWRLLKANAAFLRLMDIKVEAPFVEIANADTRFFSFYAMASALVRQVESLEIVKNFEFRLTREAGGHYWLSIDARQVLDAEGKTGYYEAYVRDITQLKIKEAELSHQTFYDSLTGLPNRELFADKLMTAIQVAKRRSDIQFAVLTMDMRGFQNINHHYGRDFGDMLLRYVATTLKACCREADSVARTASDEFSMLLHGPGSGTQIIKVIKRIRAKLDMPFTAWEQVINSVRVDIGVIFPLKDYNKAESVLRDADIAVNKAKGTHGSLGCKFFSKRMLKSARKHLSLSINLQEKHDLREFYLAYQPIVRQTDGALHSFEALVRWQHEGKTIPPSVFIPIAEETGFIKKLGAFVIEESCRQLRHWQDKYGSNVELHVNISPYQLFMPAFPDKVLDTLYHTGVATSSLLFEVTESAFLRDIDKVLFNINAVRKEGIRFCLDDFGTGYSSLSSLKNLPIECLKIDRSFVSDLERDVRSRILLKHILCLGADFGYSIVVEGVERQTQINLLDNVEDLLIQGYYFFKPLSADSAEALIKKQLS